MAIDSRTSFEVWQLVIYDELLSRSVFDGSYRELAKQRGYTADQVAVLDWFAEQPGMRWNVENLRFRAALETAACLCIHLPKTARLLSRGNDDWLQDICYEYLSYHSWDALGHRRLTECERFGRYVHDRIKRRRIMPPHLEQVLELELAIVGVLKQTAGLQWPIPPVLDGEELAACRPRRGPAQCVLEQPVDLRAFMSADEPDRVEPGPGPVTWLIYLASPTQNPCTKIVSEGPRILLEHCSGDRTTREIAAAMEAELELPTAQITRLVETWLAEGVLVI
ncbi:MAG: hypothetical protein ABI867_01950 [Kofleriaceae bacterium]